jgi:hypothetical protein
MTQSVIHVEVLRQPFMVFDARMTLHAPRDEAGLPMLDLSQRRIRSGRAIPSTAAKTRPRRSRYSIPNAVVGGLDRRAYDLPTRDTLLQRLMAVFLLRDLVS